MSISLAVLLTVFGSLLLVAVLLDGFAPVLRLPGILLVLLLGLLTENDLDSVLTQREQLLTLGQANAVSQVALVLVLFFVGLSTSWRALRDVIQPAGRLATLGSLLSALIVTVVVVVLGELPISSVHPGLPVALFVGAMVCSTDASAVLAVLRPLQAHLPRRLIHLIECESAFNDPVAVVLAGVALTMATGHGQATPPALVIEGLRQFLLGALVGFLGGSLAAQLLAARITRSRASHLPVVSLAVLILLAGGTELLGGSGLLAAYIAGLVLANSPGADAEELQEAHAGFAKMAELLLFLCLGLVVPAEQVVALAMWSLVLFLVMQLARWLMVELLLVRAGFRRAERILVSASGLRGAVPIALALKAADSGVPWGAEMPPLALGVVLLGLVLQGLTLVPLARRLGLASAQ